jgi:hypothetical protein
VTVAEREVVVRVVPSPKLKVVLLIVPEGIEAVKSTGVEASVLNCGANTDASWLALTIQLGFSPGTVHWYVVAVDFPDELPVRAPTAK